MKKILITGGSGFIGGHLIEEVLLFYPDCKIMNLDLVSPSIEKHKLYWEYGDINNYKDSLSVILEFNPDFLVHLAAKTDTLSNNINDYFTNINGVENIIKIANQCTNLNKSVITLTQYVYRDIKNPYPNDFDDFKPHTIYGVSKMHTELITKKKSIKPYVIIRPTNVYGPRNKNYTAGLFNMIRKGLFFLPSGHLSVKSYAFVKNIAYQIIKIMEDDKNDKTVVYVGEKEISSRRWLELVYNKIKGGKPVNVPSIVLKLLAIFGDLINKLGLNFPFYSTRFKNMKEDYYVPIKSTIETYGVKYNNLELNIEETIKSFKDEQ